MLLASCVDTTTVTNFEVIPENFQVLKKPFVMLCYKKKIHDTQLTSANSSFRESIFMDFHGILTS
jgi:hypothetical protein